MNKNLNEILVDLHQQEHFYNVQHPVHTETYKGEEFRITYSTKLNALRIFLYREYGHVSVVISSKSLTKDYSIDRKHATFENLIKMLDEAYEKAMEKKKATGETVKVSETKIVDTRKPQVNTKSIKASASMTFGKYVDKDRFEVIQGRYMTVDVTVKAKSRAEVEEAFDLLAKGLEAESLEEINWSTCPTVEEYKGVWHYMESFCLPYEYGLMAEMKKDLKADFNVVKKDLGFR